MHYGIATYGSRGDFQPYAALALGLIKRGHQVTLLANENFAEYAVHYGITFHPLHGNIQAMMQTPGVLHILKSGNMIAFFRHLQKASHSLQPIVNEQSLKSCSTVDVLVSSPLAMLWIYSIAEKLGKQWALIQLSLPASPTRAFPFGGLAILNTPWYNLFSHHLIRFIYWWLNKKDVRQHRRALGLGSVKKSVLQLMSEQRILVLYAFSPALVPRPADWPSHIQISGFLTLPPTADGSAQPDTPTDKLMFWLRQGEKPIYIGFGSIPIPDPTRFGSILLELLAKTSYRMIVCAGWSEPLDIGASDRLFQLGAIDHGWLLPQCSMAIIHGGVGTVAAVLRAGIPAIVVSIFGDQPFWGKLVESRRLGIHIPFKKLSAENLLEALLRASTHEIFVNATGMGAVLREEDGVSTAIRYLERYFYGSLPKTG